MFYLSLKYIHIYFLICPRKRRGREIRTGDLHFMRRDPQPIKLPHEDKIKIGYCHFNIKINNLSYVIRVSFDTSASMLASDALSRQLVPSH
jgi:hypothetical protein